MLVHNVILKWIKFKVSAFLIQHIEVQQLLETLNAVSIINSQMHCVNTYLFVFFLYADISFKYLLVHNFPMFCFNLITLFYNSTLWFAQLCNSIQQWRTSTLNTSPCLKFRASENYQTSRRVCNAFLCARARRKRNAWLGTRDAPHSFLCFAGCAEARRVFIAKGIFVKRNLLVFFLLLTAPCVKSTLKVAQFFFLTN